MKIWIICQYYRPEPGAPSARLSGLAKIWKQAGQEVSILTGQPNHPKGVLHEDYVNKPAFMEEEIEGVNVKRHWLWIAPNKGKWPRVLNQLSFAASVLFKNIFSTNDKPEVIMASSPSFFCVMSAWLLARRYRAKFIFEVRDLWPAIFVEMGILKEGAILKILEAAEMFLYRRADAIVTVTRGFAQNIVDRGIDGKKIFVIPNGVSDSNVEVAQGSYERGAPQSLRTQLQINPLTKVVMYIGNHGDAQALGQIVDAARLLMTRSDILFLMVGQGSDKDRLVSLGRGVPNLRFLPSVKPEEVWDYYALSDISLVCLKDIPNFSMFIPSKMFEIMASKTAMVGCLAGEGAQILEESGSALVVPSEQPEKLAKAIASLMDTPDRIEHMAEHGFNYVQQKYLHSQLGNQYLGVFSHVMNPQEK